MKNQLKSRLVPACLTVSKTHLIFSPSLRIVNGKAYDHADCTLNNGVLITKYMPLSSKIVVGWRESIALPEWGITTLRAKIDTGARTSAIDVDQIKRLRGGLVKFDVVLSNTHRRRKKWITAKVVRETVVRSSNGSRETRYVVSTDLKLGSLIAPVEFTLVSRENMLCRMLIGRSALTPHYIVDAARTYLTRPRKPKVPLK